MTDILEFHPRAEYRPVRRNTRRLEQPRRRELRLEPSDPLFEFLSLTGRVLKFKVFAAVAGELSRLPQPSSRLRQLDGLQPL